MTHDFFELRWRMNWTDGKSKAGAWSDPGAKDDPLTKASTFSSEGLAVANIEARNKHTGKIVVLASVPGSDFCCFQWLGTVKINQSTRQVQHLKPQIKGLSIVARAHVATALVSGLVQMKRKTFKDETMQYGRI